MKYITTKEKFISDAVERFSDRIESFDIDKYIAADKNVTAKMFSDEDIAELYGSAELLQESMKFWRNVHRGKQEKRIADEIRTLATIRFFGDVELYEGYDNDDAGEIAGIVYAKIMKIEQ